VLALLLLALADPAQPFYEQGVAHFRAGNPAAAVEPLARAVELNPKHAQAWKALGASYAAQADFPNAAAPFRTACELEPKLEDACYYYGRNAYALNQFDLSLSVLEKALRHDRRPARVHLGLAQALEALGRRAEAEPVFRKAMEANQRASRDQRLRPGEDPRLHYGVFLFREARTEEALRSFEAALKDSPEHARIRMETGRALFQLGRIEEAAPHLERAVQLEPENGPAHLLLGKVYARLGRDAEAARELELGRANAASGAR
jgi:Flp pilus assembly protein TadD